MASNRTALYVVAAPDRETPPLKTIPTFEHETTHSRQGRRPVAGIDEAGRGPLAGPVCAAAVVLDPDALPTGVLDSKAMTEALRLEAFEAVMTSALAVSFAFASVREIDATDIRRATHLAMTRAWRGLSVSPAWTIVDGNDLPRSMRGRGETLVKGDAKCLSVAAASVVAKTCRDRAMRRLDATYPGYGFAAHSGYGTPEHLAAIAKAGPCPAHRMTFAPLNAKARIPDLFDLVSC